MIPTKLKFPSKSFMQRLLCKHFYIYRSRQLIETGTRRMIIYQCLYCGKTKLKFV